MYGCLSDLYSYYEYAHSVEVCKEGQSVCVQVSVFAFPNLHFNAFYYRHISHLPATRGWERKVAEAGPCVILASPGFMSSGPSRELLELWAPDARNGVIITGYSIEGTMARVSLYSVFSQVYELERCNAISFSHSSEYSSKPCVPSC